MFGKVTVLAEEREREREREREGVSVTLNIMINWLLKRGTYLNRYAVPRNMGNIMLNVLLILGIIISFFSFK